MHRLYVQEKGFILTQDLKVGDPLLGLKKVSRILLYHRRYYLQIYGIYEKFIALIHHISANAAITSL